METFGLYLLKSVTWIAGFALIFILFLRNERFFFLNRIYLLAGILTSFFFPLISIHYTVILPVVQNMPMDNAVVNEIQNTGRSILPDLKIILLALYVTGVLFVITLILRQGKSVLRTIKKSEKVSIRPIKLIKTSDYTSAFSFFSYVFVNPSITDVETKEIMIHEMVHIRQKHWVDLLLVELLCMMQWFNPLVWIYVRFIRQNHEYLADEVALKQTSDPAIYKAVLLNQIVGAPVVSLSNSFNYSPNKKRFAMMKNIITSPYRKMKVLLILPVFALVLFSFARPDYKYRNLNDSSSNFASTTAEQKTVKGKVVTKDDEPLPGATVVVQGTTMGASADIKGYFKIDNVPEDRVLIASFVGFKTKRLKPDFNSDMTIRMVKDTINYSGLEEVAPPPPPPPPVPSADNIKDIKDVTPPPSLNDGVIVIQTKNKAVNQNHQGTEKAKQPFVVVEEMPEFPGGRDAMMTWIAANIKYPSEAAKGGIEGKVYVNFTVNAAGKVKDVVVTKSVSPSLNAEAIRVISSMPEWTPAKQAGKSVAVKYNVPVEFKLK